MSTNKFWHKIKARAEARKNKKGESGAQSAAKYTKPGKTDKVAADKVTGKKASKKLRHAAECLAKPLDEAKISQKAQMAMAQATASRNATAMLAGKLAAFKNATSQMFEKIEDAVSNTIEGVSKIQAAAQRTGAIDSGEFTENLASGAFYYNNVRFGIREILISHLLATSVDHVKKEDPDVTDIASTLLNSGGSIFKHLELVGQQAAADLAGEDDFMLYVANGELGINQVAKGSKWGRSGIVLRRCYVGPVLNTQSLVKLALAIGITGSSRNWIAQLSPLFYNTLADLFGFRSSKDFSTANAA